MGMPEPEAPKPEATPSADRADWLVGAEEGLAAEMERHATESAFMARPALLRPGIPEAPPARIVPDAAPEPECAAPGIPLSQRPGLAPPPGVPAPTAPTKRFGAVTPDLGTGSEFVQGPAMTWEPGARSVPTLGSEPPCAPAPAPLRDFPMDDAEERSRARAAALEDAMADAVAATRPHEVVSPEAFNAEAVPVPWWISVVHVLRTDRRLQGLVLVVLVLLTAIALWPRGDKPTAVSRLRRHSERYDGASVQVSGRVGQVYRVGGGYAFYLIDRGDTLVVFTRSRVPVERQRVHVFGTMSNGSLDGQPTLALFESADAKP
jgi:hypothetical protein